MQFEKAVQTLCDAAVEFVVIGGLSATLHGSAQVIATTLTFAIRAQQPTFASWLRRWRRFTRGHEVSLPGCHLFGTK